MFFPTGERCNFCDRPANFVRAPGAPGDLGAGVKENSVLAIHELPLQNSKNSVRLIVSPAVSSQDSGTKQPEQANLQPCTQITALL